MHDGNTIQVIDQLVPIQKWAKFKRLVHKALHHVDLLQEYSTTCTLNHS